MKILKNKKGFTLIELIVVIAILGILSAISVPRFIGFNERARIAADQATVRTLNSVTPLARLNISVPDPFIDENKSDEELIEFLESGGYLAEAVMAQSKDASFAWLIDDERWYLMFEDSFYLIRLGDGLTIHNGGMLGAWNGSEEYSGSSRDIILPSILNDIIITRIGQNTFRNKGLVAVTFQNGSQIEHIHARAFQNNNLTEIVLPDSLTRIDTRAFYGNPISTVKISDGVTTIENNAFNTLTKVTVGGNLTNISNGAINGNNAFRDAYEAGGAGTYIWDGESWIKQ